MADYTIGYGKPPVSARFKPGVSGNPAGRPKHKPSAIAEIIKRMPDALIRYRERGRTKVSTYHELSLKMLVDNAVSGDLNAAELALQILERAETFGDSAADAILVENWLANHPGQTTAEMAEGFAAMVNATPDEWWKSLEPRTKARL